MAQLTDGRRTCEDVLEQWAVRPEKIVAAVEQIVEIAKPWRVVAFGSRARGDHRADSDLDLAVIVEEYDGDTRHRPIWRADVDAFFSMDLLVMSRERFEFMKDSVISVQRQIDKDGVILYDAGIGSIDRGAARRLAR